MKWGVLFAGIGGVDFGLLAAGHDIAWAIENDAVAAQCYRWNHVAPMIEQDVRTVDVTTLAPIDALWLSPVCKSHSVARSKHLPEREDADIGVAALPYIAYHQPHTVIIENVAGYRKHPSLTHIVTFLAKRGYTIDMRVLNFADYGVPQHRKRLIVIARQGIISWPTPLQRISWYDAIEDLLPTLPETTLANWQFRRWQQKYEQGTCMVNGAFVFGSDTQCVTSKDNVSPTITASHNNRDRRIVLPATMIDGRLGYNDGDGTWDLREIQHTNPSNTITASDNNMKRRIVFGDARVLQVTPRVLARLQTLPDTCIFPDRAVDACKLIGNAVPPLFVQHLTAGMSTHRTAKAVEMTI